MSLFPPGKMSIQSINYNTKYKVNTIQNSKLYMHAKHLTRMVRNMARVYSYGRYPFVCLSRFNIGPAGTWLVPPRPTSNRYKQTNKQTSDNISYTLYLIIFFAPDEMHIKYK